MSRAFLRMVRKSDFPVFRSDHAIPGAGAFRLPARLVQQHSGDWTMTGKVLVARVESQELLSAAIGRVKAIQHIKTMAGSPDADLALRSASRNLAHGFCVPGFHVLRETMKEDRNVQDSFSRDRLGWPSPQA
jgi:hypothetical protein